MSETYEQAIYMSFKKDNVTSAQKATAEFISAHPELNATEPKDVKFGSNDFCKTTYIDDNSKVNQLIHTTGKTISTLTLVGEGVETDPKVASMLSQMIFKDESVKPKQ